MVWIFGTACRKTHLTLSRDSIRFIGDGDGVHVIK